MAGTRRTLSRTYLRASAKWESRVKGLRPHTSGNNLSTPGETGNVPASMATNQNWWGRHKGKSLAAWGSVCTHITGLDHFITYFQGHRELEGALSFLPSSYLFSPLPVLLPSPPQKLSLCAFPISFPNRSLYYSRNCQGKQTTKMASLSPNRKATETVLTKAWSEHVSLVNFWIFPAQGWGLLVEDEGGVMKGERKPFSSQFGYVLKS